VIALDSGSALVHRAPHGLIPNPPQQKLGTHGATKFLQSARELILRPSWSGKLSGFTLLFEALVMALSREVSFSAVGRITALSVHRVMAICHRYVEHAVSLADHSEVKRVAIDETSRAKGHEYVTLAADAERRAVIFVAEGKDANTIEGLAGNLRTHRGRPSQIEAISIDMSPAFIKGVSEHFPNAQVTFDKFHVIAHASAAIDETRRLEQKIDPSVGIRMNASSREAISRFSLSRLIVPTRVRSRN
jgi:transposase